MIERSLKGVSMRLLAAAVVATISFAFAECALRLVAPAREIGPAFTRYDDYYGKRLKSSVSLVRETPYFTMRLTTNRLGFRGPEPRGDPHGALVFLGDSFTMGYGVNDGEEFPERIHRQLGDELPVINAGMGDTGNGLWVKFLQRDAERFSPRIVVLQVQENDFSDNRRERYFALEDGVLSPLPIPPKGLARHVQEWIDRVPGLASSHLIGRLRMLVDKPARAVAPVASPTVAPSPAEPLTLQLIDAALAACAARNWPALGVLADVRGERERAVVKLFNDSGVPFVRIPTKTERPDLYFDVDGHWNAAGHAYAADAIVSELREMSVIPR